MVQDRKRSTVERPRVDVLLVTAMGVEFQALCQFLPELTQDQPEYLVTLPRDGRRPPLQLAIRSIGEQSNVPAHGAVLDAIDRQQPRAVIMVGIAAGFAENGVQLGDILVPSHIVPYDHAKVTDKLYDFRGSPIEVSYSLREAANALSIDPKKPWSQLTGLPSPPSPGAADRLSVHAEKPSYLGSGDKLVATINAEARRRLIKVFKTKAVGLEMESYGSILACKKRETSFLLVKAVQDPATVKKDDKRRKDEWRPYAAAASAAFTVTLLSRYEFPNKNDEEEIARRTRNAPRNHYRTPDEHADDSSVLALVAAPAERIFRTGSVTLESIESMRFLLAWPKSIPKVLKDPFATKDVMPPSVGGLAGLAATLSIPRLVEVLEKERQAVARAFCGGADGHMFNGGLWGIFGIREGRVGQAEEPSLHLRMYPTDYFTNRVMQATYRRLVNAKLLTAPGSELSTVLDKWFPFATAVSLNTLLLFKEDPDRQALLSVRSSLASDADIYGGKYHISMAEAVSQTDVDLLTGDLKLQKTFERGLTEELGITDAFLSQMDSGMPEVKITDLFYNPDYFQFGFASYAELPFDGREVLKLPAQDKTLESGGNLKLVPFEVRALQRLATRERFVPHGLFTLRRVAARLKVFL